MANTTIEERLSRRLRRLISSGICPEEGVTEYLEDLRQLAAKVMNLKQIHEQNRLLKALANPTRLKMINLLQMRELSECEIIAALDLTQPTASHHLNILENVGVVNDRREGKWVFYSLTPNATQLLNGFLNKQ